MSWKITLERDSSKPSGDYIVGESGLVHPEELKVRIEADSALDEVDAVLSYCGALVSIPALLRQNSDDDRFAELMASVEKSAVQQLVDHWIRQKIASATQPQSV